MGELTDARITVLVVEDTDHVRRMLTTMLSIDGFDVVGGVSDGETAIAESEASKPDVVVVDYRMPGIDGLETARRIRALRPTQQVIVYSAFVDEEIEREAADIGVALCVGKIEGIEALEHEIKRVARSKSAR